MALPGSRVISLKIKRQDRPNAPSRWERFDVPYDPNMNVISCLQKIAANPVTADGTKTTPVTWDCSCLEEVCGSCTMVINGQVRQSCSALIDDLLEQGDVIVLEPMSKFPVVRDLMVDRQRMFDQLKRVRAWIPIDGTYDLGEGPRMDENERSRVYPFSRCMTCGCCLEVCPQYGRENVFVGASAIGQVTLFNSHPTGKRQAAERLEALMGPGGITDCGNAQNCVKACPKDIPLLDGIGRAGRHTTVHAIKKFFNH